MAQPHDILHVRPGAGLGEVKRAYRRLARQYHPDTAPGGSGDAARFQAVHEAYRTLSQGLGGSEPDPVVWEGFSSSRAADPGAWGIRGIYHEGLNVVYVLRLKASALSPGGVRLTLPWQKETACPRCLGAGSAAGDPDRGPCPRCQGRGVVVNNTFLAADLPERDVLAGEHRLARQGHYRPATAERGDLILEIELEFSPGHSAPVYQA
jgi:molecular chaperone DnaJ